MSIVEHFSKICYNSQNEATFLCTNAVMLSNKFKTHVIFAELSVYLQFYFHIQKTTVSLFEARSAQMVCAEAGFGCL